MNLIVFDIDDTLTKSENQHQLAYVNTMKAFGITSINKNWSTYLHHTDSYILKENYNNNLDDSFEFSFVDDFEVKMTEQILKLKPVSEIKGAVEIIKKFNDHPDYALAFATGSFLNPAFVKLNQSGIDYHNKLVVGSNKIFDREGIVKEAINRAKEYNNVDSFDRIISVGDGIWDLKTARNLGVYFIGIGLKNYEDFKIEKIKYHIKDWENFSLNDVEKVLFNHI